MNTAKFPQIMGIVNVTPDSFSDGGKHFSLEQAVEGGLAMVEQGADWLDIGGESTRPGAQPVSVEQELERVIPVIEALRANSDIKISIDTSKAEVMGAAVKAGANLINDVYALRQPGALEAAVAANVPVCLMHMQGTPDTMQDNPQYADPVEEVISFLQQRAEVCINAGINKDKLIFDPGFGFGKSLAHNYQLLRQVSKIVDTGYQTLIGISRKSMIANVVKNDTQTRLAGSIAAATLAMHSGAQYIRVHDVAQTVDARAVCLATQDA